MGKQFLQGTYGKNGDEGAIIALVARKIVPHGGYFCLYQMQCGNKWRNRRAWMQYFFPSGKSEADCMWLCEAGYSGTNCGPISATTTAATNELTTVYSSPKLKLSGERSGERAGEVSVFQKDFHTGFRKKAHDLAEMNVVLGAVKLTKHGAFVAPVEVACNWQDWSRINSFVRSANTCSTSALTPKLLCREGYLPNPDNTDCILATEDAIKTYGVTFCSNFPRDGYKSEMHTIDSSGSCAKYFCKEFGYAFRSDTDKTCTLCETSVIGGASRVDGLCKKCNIGQYLDAETGECRTADAYSKVDMRYGKGRNASSQKAWKNHCWQYVAPSEYKLCVENGGMPDDETEDTSDDSESPRTLNPNVQKVGEIKL